ncbi:MAG: homoserine dehydrogenase [Arenimonas sp.]
MSQVNASQNISPLAKQTTLALLGTGTVGSAFLSRLTRLQKTQQVKKFRLVQVSNTRHSIRDFLGLDPSLVPEDLPNNAPDTLEQVARTLGYAGIIVDATASEEVAGWHSRWLASGFKVVTANKAGTGGNFSSFQIINHQIKNYGDAATVGAGLPLLRSLRELRSGGDNIHCIAGILSGSLAWLFNNYDGMRPFSSFVREARTLGYTEPDPRIDLSGQDVKRKLLILARTAGYALEADSIQVESLLPPELANANLQDVDSQLESLDAPLRARFLAAHRIGRRLRFIARLNQAGEARIGLEALTPDDALANGSGCDNRVAIWSDRYNTQPLVIQGPGAGAEVTAAALLDDVIRLS